MWRTFQSLLKLLENRSIAWLHRLPRGTRARPGAAWFCGRGRWSQAHRGCALVPPGAFTCPRTGTDVCPSANADAEPASAPEQPTAPAPALPGTPAPCPASCPLCLMPQHPAPALLGSHRREDPAILAAKTTLALARQSTGVPPAAFHRGPWDGSWCLRLLARTCGTRKKAKRALATLDGVLGSQPALLNAAGAGSFAGRRLRGTSRPQSSRQTRVQSPQPDIHTCISLTLLGW